MLSAFRITPLVGWADGVDRPYQAEHHRKTQKYDLTAEAISNDLIT